MNIHVIIVIDIKNTHGWRNSHVSESYISPKQASSLKILIFEPLSLLKACFFAVLFIYLMLSTISKQRKCHKYACYSYNKNRQANNKRHSQANKWSTWFHFLSIIILHKYGIAYFLTVSTKEKSQATCQSINICCHHKL